MLKNINYNILETITVLSRSLHRYDTYMEDAETCPSCRELWTEFAGQRKKELSSLLKELKAHMDNGQISFE